ncbi:MAG TPA: ribonuclease HIII [Marinilabiliales bacterium]|jgi:ribonuclease HIII|nr:ribonuclease HIII [Synergistaceae bacterium]MDD3333631.1 ribonuclease HIII [Proteiniphilum sp.]HAM99812.1 ribonuclease HIII [Marinilabiliales bacterium]
MDNKEILDSTFTLIKPKLEQNGYVVSDFKYIDYGFQFSIVRSLWKGVLRVYANKKQQIKYDLSQLKEEAIKNQIESILNENTSTEESNEVNKENNNETTSISFVPIIGTDESGKGDYFGPLVSAGVYVDLTTKPLLERIGVCDSKKLNDTQIKEIAQNIKKICVNQFSVIEISPETYNNLYNQFKSEGKNLNVLLAWAHAKAIEEVLTKVECENALSDKFADEKFIISKLQEKGKRINLRQEHKAEANIAVAAASILARERFLTKLKKLSMELGIELPKGASPHVIEQAKKVVEKSGEETLKKIAKLHFKTTDSVIK